MEDMIFKNEEERVATEKVLAAFKVKNINENIDVLISEIIDYANRMDAILEENGFTKRYLDKVSNLSENNHITLDEDLKELDFRVKEQIEDLIKRINTRIVIMTSSDETLKKLEESYDLNNLNLEEEIIKANLGE